MFFFYSTIRVGLYYERYILRATIWKRRHFNGLSSCPFFFFLENLSTLFHELLEKKQKEGKRKVKEKEKEREKKKEKKDIIAFVL